MYDPRHLKALKASTACQSDSFTFMFYTCKLPRYFWLFLENVRGKFRSYWQCRILSKNSTSLCLLINWFALTTHYVMKLSNNWLHLHVCISSNLQFLVIPFHLQSVPVHSRNYVKNYTESCRNVLGSAPLQIMGSRTFVAVGIYSEHERVSSIWRWPEYGWLTCRRPKLHHKVINMCIILITVSDGYWSKSITPITPIQMGCNMV